MAVEDEPLVVAIIEMIDACRVTAVIPASGPQGVRRKAARTRMHENADMRITVLSRRLGPFGIYRASAYCTQIAGSISLARARRQPAKPRVYRAIP